MFCQLGVNWPFVASTVLAVPVETNNKNNTKHFSFQQYKRPAMRTEQSSDSDTVLFYLVSSVQLVTDEWLEVFKKA